MAVAVPDQGGEISFEGFTGRRGAPSKVEAAQSLPTSNSWLASRPQMSMTKPVFMHLASSDDDCGQLIKGHP
jgi:hypothetical protein